MRGQRRSADGDIIMLSPADETAREWSSPCLGVRGEGEVDVADNFRTMRKGAGASRRRPDTRPSPLRWKRSPAVPSTKKKLSLP
jgi:hypothetical protein